jgi:hypothetical protein
MKENGWAEHVERLAGMPRGNQILVANIKERDHHENLNVDGMITLKWAIKQ